MVKKWIKFVRKQWRKDEILLAVEKIKNWDFFWLDIAMISWKTGYYRCRIWKIRILFFEKGSNYYIEEVWMRGDIYKNI